ncbi:MAG TPA: hypothetical protein PK542_08250 [Treponemataceae bacterium]|nr:hypothetical protein [Treponemataceae bacterium]
MIAKKALMAIAVVCLAAALRAEVTTRANAVAFPVASLAPGDAQAVEIPAPQERPLLDGILAGADSGADASRRAKVMQTAGWAGIAFGIALSAFGFAAIYRAADDNPDPDAAHRGIALVLSGSLVSAFSSSLARAPRNIASREAAPLTATE